MQAIRAHEATHSDQAQRRVLAECEAKRRIVEEHASRYPVGEGPPHRWLKYLATVYADHPDYRQEWKP